jgi:hypothetical protein
MEKIFINVGIVDYSLPKTSIVSISFKTEKGDIKHWHNGQDISELKQWVKLLNNPVFITNHFMPVDYLFNKLFNDDFITDDVIVKTRRPSVKTEIGTYQYVTDYDIIRSTCDEITKYKVLNLWYVLQFKDTSTEPYTVSTGFEELDQIYNKHKTLIDNLL